MHDIHRITNKPDSASRHLLTSKNESTKKDPIVPHDIILPPPPLFDNVSDERSLPITVVPKQIVLPTPNVAETTMQSSTSTSPECENPPPVNYDSHPILAYVRFDETPPRIIAPELAPYPPKGFECDSISSDEYYRELAVSPVIEDRLELHQVHYGVLPKVSQVSVSPCPNNSHDTFDFVTDEIPYYVPSYSRNNSPGLTPSPVSPYPVLTTVAGTYNPYTSLHTKVTSTPIEAVVKSTVINYPKSNDDEGDAPKSLTPRRVHFGDVTTAPDDSVGNSEIDQDDELPKPAWTDEIKAFAIGEVNLKI